MTSLYDQSIPLLIQWMNNAIAVIEKGEAWAKENGKTDADILNSRIHPDMLPLTFQVNTMTNQAKNLPHNVIGQPELELAEPTSIADLKTRLSKTIEYLQSVKPSDMEGKEKHEFPVTFPFGTFKFTGQSYLSGFILPNFYFHYTTLYDIFRMMGVTLGKLDFLKQDLTPA